MRCIYGVRHLPGFSRWPSCGSSPPSATTVVLKSKRPPLPVGARYVRDGKLERTLAERLALLTQKVASLEESVERLEKSLANLEKSVEAQEDRLETRYLTRETVDLRLEDVQRNLQVLQRWAQENKRRVDRIQSYQYKLIGGVGVAVFVLTVALKIFLK